MSRGPKRPFGGATPTPAPASPPKLTSVLSAKAETPEIEADGNVTQIASRSFFTLPLADGGEVGIRPSAVLWYRSTDHADFAEVGLSDTTVLTVPLDAKRFAARLRQFEKR